jgi:hypothetical protein
MKNKWSTTKLIAVGSLAALNVSIQIIASLITLTSGIITCFSGPILVGLSLLLINKTGSAFIFLVMTGILDVPLSIAGPPGFLPKVLVYISLGLIIELVYFCLKKNSKKLAVILVGGIENVFITLSVIALANIFHVPGTNTISKFMSLPMTIALFIVGSLSGYFAYLIYQKIKNTAIVKRIQN